MKYVGRLNLSLRKRGMETRPLHLIRIDPARNMARYYTLSIEPSLFGTFTLTRQWGRIGTRGQLRLELHDTMAAAQSARHRLLTKKLKRGYCL